jgi:hypothetical protein
MALGKQQIRQDNLEGTQYVGTAASLTIPIKRNYDGNKSALGDRQPGRAAPVRISGQTRVPGNKPDDFPASDD